MWPSGMEAGRWRNEPEVSLDCMAVWTQQRPQGVANGVLVDIQDPNSVPFSWHPHDLACDLPSLEYLGMWA